MVQGILQLLKWRSRDWILKHQLLIVAINIAQNGFIGNGKSQFNALVIPNNRGIDINRAVDSEYKIFSNVSDLLGNRYNAKGNLTIFTERHACKICLGVADQFKKQYQNINIYIFDNNGSMVIPK